VPYVEDNATQEGSNTPLEADISRMIWTEVETWTPPNGPDWAGVVMRLAGAGPSPWVIYTTASVALTVILVTAFIVGSVLQLGGLAPQPVPTNLH
jgi:hypothetical protein